MSVGYVSSLFCVWIKQELKKKKNILKMKTANATSHGRPPTNEKTCLHHGHCDESLNHCSRVHHKVWKLVLKVHFLIVTHYFPHLLLMLMFIVHIQLCDDLRENVFFQKEWEEWRPLSLKRWTTKVQHSNHIICSSVVIQCHFLW